MATVALEKEHPNEVSDYHVSFSLERYFNNFTTGLKVMGLAEKCKTCKIREILKM